MALELIDDSSIAASHVAIDRRFPVPGDNLPRGLDYVLAVRCFQRLPSVAGRWSLRVPWKGSIRGLDMQRLR
jgi:hypothetical protein